jgi:hypothetical protein
VRQSFSSFQAFVAFAAGLTSVAGAAYSGIEYLRPAAVGEVVAVVQDARTEKPVRGGSLEVLTMDETVRRYYVNGAGVRFMPPVR